MGQVGWGCEELMVVNPVCPGVVPGQPAPSHCGDPSSPEYLWSVPRKFYDNSVLFFTHTHTHYMVQAHPERWKRGSLAWAMQCREIRKAVQQGTLDIFSCGSVYLFCQAAKSFHWEKIAVILGGKSSSLHAWKEQRKKARGEDSLSLLGGKWHYHRHTNTTHLNRVNVYSRHKSSVNPHGALIPWEGFVWGRVGFSRIKAEQQKWVKSGWCVGCGRWESAWSPPPSTIRWGQEQDTHMAEEDSPAAGGDRSLWHQRELLKSGQGQ